MTLSGYASPQSRALLGRGLLAVALIGVAVYSLLVPIAIAVLWGAGSGFWSYAAAQNAVSYFDTGFARRELEGSLIRLFTANPMAGTLWFHFVAYSILTALGIALVCRPGIRSAARLSMCAVFAAVLARVALDIGLADAAVMACGLAACWAVSKARWIMGAAALFVALLFHETGVIVLGPTVFAVALATGSWRHWRNRSAALGATILFAGAVLYAFSFHGLYDVPAIASRVRHLIKDPTQADLALYANLTGLRALKSAICYNLRSPIYPVHVACGALVCLVLVAGLQPGRPALGLLVALVPFAFLSVVATDIGRWATFSAFSLFAMSAVTESKDAGRAPSLCFASSGAALLVALATLGSVGFAPIPIVDAYLGRYGLKDLDPAQGTTACDPSWRTALDLSGA